MKEMLLYIGTCGEYEIFEFKYEMNRNYIIIVNFTHNYGFMPH